MAKTFMKSRWWHLTTAIASLATVGYAVYIAGVYMTCYETWKFISQRKTA